MPFFLDLHVHADVADAGDPLGELRSEEVGVDHAAIGAEPVVVAEGDIVVACSCGVPGLMHVGLVGVGGALHVVAPHGVGVVKDYVAHQDVLSLIRLALGLNPETAPVGDVLDIAGFLVPEGVGGNDGDLLLEWKSNHHLASNIDRRGVVLGVAWLKGDLSIGPEVVEVEGLGRVDVINADIILIDPAGVGALFTAEMVEGVVVDITLGALIVKVDLLLTVELAVALVFNLR